MSMFSNWFGSKSPPAAPEVTPLQAQRAKQIEQLQATHRNVIEVHRNLEYRVSLIVNGTTFYLYLTLPPRFPEDPPQIRVAPPVHHAWVDNQSLLSRCPHLKTFTVHTSLGRVVKEIIEEFQQNPPALVSQPQQHLPTASQPAPYPVSSYSSPPSHQPNIYPHNIPPNAARDLHSNVTQPLYPPAENLWNRENLPNTQPVFNQQFPQLTEMSKDKLEELLKDDDVADELVLSLPDIQRAVKANETLCEVNQLLSRSNLTKKPLLEERKRTLLEKHELLSEARTEFDKNFEQQSKLQAGFTPQAMQDQLRIAAMQAEEESDTVAEEFLQGKIGVEEFKKVFMEKRKLSHARKLKEEKLYTPGLLQSIGGL